MKVTNGLSGNASIQKHFDGMPGLMYATDIPEDNTMQKAIHAYIIHTIQVRLRSICPDIESIRFALAPNRLPVRNQLVGLDLLYLNQDKPEEPAIIQFYYREENEPGFFGLIVLQSRKIADELIAKTKPGHTEFINNIKTSISAKNNQVINEAITINIRLFHGEASQRLCKALCDKSEDGSITQETIRSIMCDFHGKQMKAPALNICIDTLCECGMIEALKQDDHFVFKLSELCYILTDFFRRKEDQIKLKSLISNKNAAEREKEKAQNETELQTRRIAVLDQEISIIRAKYPGVNLETYK